MREEKTVNISKRLDYTIRSPEEALKTARDVAVAVMDRVEGAIRDSIARGDQAGEIEIEGSALTGAIPVIFRVRARFKTANSVIIQKATRLEEDLKYRDYV